MRNLQFKAGYRFVLTSLILNEFFIFLNGCGYNKILHKRLNFLCLLFVLGGKSI